MCAAESVSTQIILRRRKEVEDKLAGHEEAMKKPAFPAGGHAPLFQKVTNATTLG